MPGRAISVGCYSYNEASGTMLRRRGLGEHWNAKESLMIISMRWKLAAVTLLSACVAGGLGAVGGRQTTLAASTNSPHAAMAAKGSNKWLAINAKSHRVVITVIAADTNANNGFNFDGYAKGKANFVVPLGWKVSFKFSNHTSLPHSLAIASGHGNGPKLPKIGGKTVQTPNAKSGIAKGKTQTLTFMAKPAGHYFMVCLVPGHDAAGMWDGLTINKGAKKPFLQVH